MNIETIECGKHVLNSLDFAAVKQKCKKKGGKTVREKTATKSSLSENEAENITIIKTD